MKVKRNLYIGTCTHTHVWGWQNLPETAWDFESQCTTKVPCKRRTTQNAYGQSHRGPHHVSQSICVWYGTRSTAPLTCTQNSVQTSAFCSIALQLVYAKLNSPNLCMYMDSATSDRHARTHCTSRLKLPQIHPQLQRDRSSYSNAFITLGWSKLFSHFELSIRKSLDLRLSMEVQTSSRQMTDDCFTSYKYVRRHDNITLHVESSKQYMSRLFWTHTTLCWIFWNTTSLATRSAIPATIRSSSWRCNR